MLVNKIESILRDGEPRKPSLSRKVLGLKFSLDVSHAYVALNRDWERSHVVVACLKSKSAFTGGQ